LEVSGVYSGYENCLQTIDSAILGRWTSNFGGKDFYHKS
jgi:hypothetical protein